MSRKFIEDPIYTTYSFFGKKNGNTVELNPKDSSFLIDVLHLNDSYIERFYCLGCEREDSHTLLDRHGDSILDGTTYRIPIYGSRLVIMYDFFAEKVSFLYSIHPQEYDYHINYLCNFDHRHSLRVSFVITIHKEILTILKYGQSVQPYFLTEDKSKKYKRELAHFGITNDYRKILLHENSNDFVAALLYARRVFEVIIDKLIDNALPKKERFEVKIRRLKELGKLEPDTQELSTQVYSLLSEGIHSLDNPSCKILFESLMSFIEFQLIYIVEKREKEQIKSRLKKEINEQTETINKIKKESE